MRDINKFSIKEYKHLSEVLKEEEIDFVELFSIFGYDINKLDVIQYNEIKFKIENIILDTPTGLVEKYYTIGGKKYKACLNLTKIKAAQFIDLQVYVAQKDIAKIISVFLLPMKRKNLFFKEAYNYNDGYDITEVQDNIENNMDIVTANNLSAFFLNQSAKLQKIMLNYSEKKLMKMKLKKYKKMKLM